MARLEELEIASLNEEQLRQLKETEDAINRAETSPDVYLMALRKKAPLT